jgi:predicted Zn-dependent protease
MSIESFRTDAPLAVPPGPGCGCRRHSRRGFTGLLLAGALPVLAQQGGRADAVDEGVRREVGKPSAAAQLVPAERVEAAAARQYAQMLQQAAQQRALAPESHPQLQRLRYIAQRLIPQAQTWNERAHQWRWEVNLLGSRDLNAFCMPGGKIAFYYGLLMQLQLSDDEVAMIMGHEMAHALREHARERMAKSEATRIGASVLSAFLGLGNTGDALLNMGGQLLTLKFSREDESEADIVGLDLAARAGYDPASGITLWQKMMGANKGAPPQWLSTHPSGGSRIAEIEAHLPKVNPLYERAAKPQRRFGPPTPRAARDASQAQGTGAP